jgi:Flp pilus assembly protein TadD
MDPSFARAHAALADALLLQVDYSGRPFEAIQGDAESSIATAMRLEPTSAEAWAARGNIELARYQLDLAEQSLRRAIELNPNFVQAQHWLSVTLQRRGRLAEALLAAETAVSLDPLSQVAAVNLANRLSDAGRFDEAEGRLRRAIQIDPSAPGPYSLLSTLQSTALNRQADAASMLEKAISLDQDSPLYLSNLATLYLDLGDPSRARRLIASAQHRWPDSGVVAIYAAIIASSQDGREAAEKLVATMVARVPRDVVPQSIMRNADLARGDHKSARARYAAAYPDLLASTPPKVDVENYWAAIDLALVLRGTGEAQRASILLRESERAIKALPRLGWGGYWIADVQIHALRGETAHALAMLRVAEQAGWRSWWLYYRDVEPNLASIRNEPEFKAIFADIERDMARQRAALAARPTDAVVELEAAGT